MPKTVHDMLPIVSGSGGETNHRAVNGRQMNLLFFFQFLGALVGRTLRAGEPSRARSGGVGSKADTGGRPVHGEFSPWGRLARICLVRQGAAQAWAALLARCGSPSLGRQACTAESRRTGKSPGPSAIGQTWRAWGKSTWLAMVAALAAPAVVAWRFACDEGPPPVVGRGRSPCRRAPDWLRNLLGCPLCLVPVRRKTEARTLVLDRFRSTARCNSGPAFPPDWA